jgi:hypothetical protein
MSTELNQYLKSQDIRVIKLVDGSTIITEVVDQDESGLMVSKPQELLLLDDEKNRAQLHMNAWMYGCDLNEVIICFDKIIAHGEASLELKDFYSKVILKRRLSAMSDQFKKLNKVNTFIPTISEVMKALFDGLEQQDLSDPNDDAFRKRRYRFPDELSD